MNKELMEKAIDILQTNLDQKETAEAVLRVAVMACAEICRNVADDTTVLIESEIEAAEQRIRALLDPAGEKEGR